MRVPGTHGYTAPEIIRGKRYGMSIDVYSAACVMAEVLMWRKNYHAFGPRPVWQAVNSEIINGLRPSLKSGDTSSESSFGSNENDKEVMSPRITRDQSSKKMMSDIATVNARAKMRILIARMWTDDPKLRPEPAEVLFELTALMEQQSKRLDLRATSNEKLQDLRVTLARQLHELMRQFCTSAGKLKEEHDRIAELFCDDCVGSFEDSHMNEAFSKYKGHDFVRAFLRLLVGASNAAVKYSFEFPPFLTREDFVDTAGAQFLARVTYNVETKVRVSHFGHSEKNEN